MSHTGDGGELDENASVKNGGTVSTLLASPHRGESRGGDRCSKYLCGGKYLRPSTEVTPLILFLLSLINANEAFGLNVLWSFVAFMVEDFGVPSSELGSFVGPLTASFFLAQLVASFFWAAVSDRYGRRPAIVIGCIGSGAAMILFGFSKQYWQAVLFRCMCGGLNGNIAVTKTYLGEVSTAKTQARGFSVLALSWAMGSLVAPSIGGLLSNPVKKYADVFGSSAFLREYPYFLPSLASALVGLSGGLLSLFFLPETAAFIKMKKEREGNMKVEVERSSAHQSSTKREREVEPEKESSGSTDGGEEEGGSVREEGDIEMSRLNGGSSVSDGRKPSRGIVRKDIRVVRSGRQSCFRRLSSRFRLSMNILRKRDVLTTCVCYALYALLTILADEIVPLYLKASVRFDEPIVRDNGEAIVREGGLGAGTQQIGAMLSASGVSLLIFQLFFFSRIVKKTGARKGLIIGVVGAWIYVIALPFAGPILTSTANMSSLRQHEIDRLNSTLYVEGEEGEEGSAAFTPWPWPVYAWLILIMAYRPVMLSLGFSCVALLINNSAPVGMLATVNAIAQVFSSSVRALGPLIGGFVWSLAVSLSDDVPIFNSFIPFLFIALVCACVFFISITIRPYLNIPAKERQDLSEGMEANEEVDSRALLDDLEEDKEYD